MELQEKASERIAKAASKYKGHLAVGAAGAAAGAYATHRARKKFDRAVDKEVHMRKARYAQIREEDRQALIAALLKEMAPAVNLAKQGTPATNAAKELLRSRRAKGGALAVGVLGAGALAMRANAKRKEQENR